MRTIIRDRALQWTVLGLVLSSCAPVDTGKVVAPVDLTEHANAGPAAVTRSIPVLSAQEQPPPPDDLFNAFLKAGQWSPKADDNIVGENVSSDLIKRLVTDYRARPNEPEAQRELGLLALAMGIAEWGIADPAGLPPDPAHKNWKSDTGPDSGKHLMSYGVGGIGISHADQSDLRDFIRYVASTDLVPSEHRDALLRLADPAVYKKSVGAYDQLRAAGVCASKKFDTDLNEEQFKHFEVVRDKKYCTKYANSSLQARDWRVLRTWMRAALRTKPGQQWLISQWMKDYWFKSLQRVPSGAGYIEEALVNVRVRNSFPRVANEAPERAASDPTGRIQRELDAYGEHKPETLRRRCGLMLRPVVLYRHFAGEPHLRDIQCPHQRFTKVGFAEGSPEVPSHKVRFPSLEKDPRFVGISNPRMLLKGVLYWGGSNNTRGSDHTAPLKPEPLRNLCDAGFSKAIYLYDPNGKDMPDVSCTDRRLKYLHIQYVKKSDHENIKTFLKLVHDVIKNDQGPMYVHCWNGIHASAQFAGIALRQFCNYSPEDAVDFFFELSKGTAKKDKCHANIPSTERKKHYCHVADAIQAFKPSDDLKIGAEEQRRICQ